MSRFTFLGTPLANLKIVERQRVGDARGFLSRLFCSDDLAIVGWHKPIAQINQTLTQKRGTVRGLHFQHAPYGEMKLVTCLRGAVWDVAVDLRSESATFLHWYGLELSAINCRALLIPEGFAHGFQTLADESELFYLHSTAYAPAAEAGLNPIDPRLSIAWPLPVVELSDRDAKHLMLDDQFKGIRL